MSEYHTTAQLNLYLKASSLEEAEELARRYVDQIKNISDVGGVEVTLWHVRTEEIQMCIRDRFSTTSRELTGTCLGDFTIAKGDEFRDLLGAMSKVLFVAEDEGVTVFDACKND